MRLNLVTFKQTKLALHQVDQLEEEIDWTRFTFQHGFRQLPQQLLQQVQQPLTSLLPSAFPDVDVKMSEASQSPSPLPPGQVATQQPATIRSDQDAASPPPSPATVPAASDLQHEPAQRAQQDSPSGQAEAEHAMLRSGDAETETAGDLGMATEGEEGQGSAGEGGPEAEGQRLTRSRRGNAAGLFMLDHGSQLIPKKVALVPSSPHIPLHHTAKHECATVLGLNSNSNAVIFCVPSWLCAYCMLHVLDGAALESGVTVLKNNNNCYNNHHSNNNNHYNKFISFNNNKNNNNNG